MTAVPPMSEVEAYAKRIRAKAGTRPVNTRWEQDYRDVLDRQIERDVKGLRHASRAFDVMMGRATIYAADADFAQGAAYCHWADLCDIGRLYGEPWT